VLEALGALDEVLQGSHTPPTYETRLHNKSISKETFNGLPWRIMTRSHLHDALVNRARAVGVDIGSTRSCRRRSGRAPDTPDREVLEADLIVSADGVGSKVRDSMGFKQDRWVFHRRYHTADVPRMKEELGHGEWDNTIDMWNFCRVFSGFSTRPATGMSSISA
jgi:2-methyl-3-hydroxypyridine 5-carboxylic acid dioxygenase